MRVTSRCESSSPCRASQLGVAPEARGEGTGQVAGGQGGRASGRGRWPGGAGEGLVLAQHGRLQPAQLGAGVDAQLVAQVAAGVLEGPQRLRLAPAAVEGDHQQAPQPLPQGVGGDQALQLLGALDVAAEVEVGLDAVLGGGQAQLLEAGPGAGGEVVEGEVGQGVAPPQGQGLVEEAGPVGGRTGGQRGPAVGDQALEPDGVDVVRRQVEEVPRGPGDDVGTAT